MTGAKEPRTGAPTYDLRFNAEFQPHKPLIYIANMKPLVKPFLLYCISTGIRCAIHDAYVQQLKLIAKNSWQVKRYALCRSRLERWHGNYLLGCAFPMASSSIVINPMAGRPLCPRKSTSHPIVASGSTFEVCSSPDVTQCARQPSQPVQMC